MRALTKKNCLIWRRNWGCSLLELISPVILMAILWIIRLQVPTTDVDKDGLLNKKLPTAIGVGH
jgi:hypothetical protein